MKALALLALALAACGGNVANAPKCYLANQGAETPIACEGSGYAWTDDAGTHDCAERCPTGAACTADGVNGTCR